MIKEAGAVLVVVSAVMGWLFCLGYQVAAPWRRTEAGRHLMVFTGTLAVVLTLWSVGVLTPTKGAWWDAVRLVAFVGVPVSLGWRLVLLYRLQIRPVLRRRGGSEQDVER